MHAYGAVGILNSIVLERAGLFYGKESSAEDPNRLAYQNVKKPMKLVVDSVSEESSNDITFAYCLRDTLRYRFDSFNLPFAALGNTTKKRSSICAVGSHSNSGNP